MARRGRPRFVTIEIGTASHGPLFGDDELLATHVRVQQLLVERFAQHTGDRIALSVEDLRWATGRRREDAALRRLEEVERFIECSLERSGSSWIYATRDSPAGTVSAFVVPTRWPCRSTPGRDAAGGRADQHRPVIDQTSCKDRPR
ncbi:hypothetical protein LCGC14_2813680 [marine sediment metagenome]|uniref:Uncharacterized protein n=1 Tax=marine sediment metagenome TaxID=412755 RepID=A0A0F9ASL2_9ZZZZ